MGINLSFAILCRIMLYKLNLVVTYMYGGPLENIQHLYSLVGSFTKDNLFGSMEEDEECEYDHKLIDDSNAQDGGTENYSVGEDNSSMCKDVVIETKLMQSHVENIHMKVQSCKVSFDMPWMF